MVACTFDGEVLPNLHQQIEYRYCMDPPDSDEKIHVLRVEQTLIDYYHGHAKCQTVDRITKLVHGVPHRVTGDRPKMTEAYGIYACQGWTLYKLMVFFVVTQSWAIVFMAVWLWLHPGDIQSAFSPGYYSLGIVTLFVAVPDIVCP